MVTGLFHEDFKEPCWNVTHESLGCTWRLWESAVSISIRNGINMNKYGNHNNSNVCENVRRPFIKFHNFKGA